MENAVDVAGGDMGLVGVVAWDEEAKIMVVSAAVGWCRDAGGGGGWIEIERVYPGEI